MASLQKSPSRVRRIQGMIEADGFDQLAHYELAREYLREGRWMEAATKFRRAVELNPQYVAAWRGLGRAYELAGVPKEAEVAWSTGAAAAALLGDSAVARELESDIRRLRDETPAHAT